MFPTSPKLTRPGRPRAAARAPRPRSRPFVRGPAPYENTRHAFTLHNLRLHRVSAIGLDEVVVSPLPNDGSDFQYEADIWIDAPPERVFEFIADLDAVPEWATKVAAIVNESPGPVAVGETFDERVALGFVRATVSWEVIEFESPYLCTRQRIDPGQLTGDLHRQVERRRCRDRADIEGQE